MNQAILILSFFSFLLGCGGSGPTCSATTRGTCADGSSCAINPQNQTQYYCTGTVDPTLICYPPTAPGYCGSSTPCADDNKDCPAVPGCYDANGVCVLGQCYYFGPSKAEIVACNWRKPDPTLLCFAAPSGDPCMAVGSCNDDNKDCNPGAPGCSSQEQGLCLGGKCYYYGPAAASQMDCQ